MRAKLIVAAFVLFLPNPVLSQPLQPDSDAAPTITYLYQCQCPISLTPQIEMISNFRIYEENGVVVPRIVEGSAARFKSFLIAFELFSILKKH